MPRKKRAPRKYLAGSSMRYACLNCAAAWYIIVMSEKGPKRVDPMDPVSVTNWVFRKLGQGVGAAARAGYEAYATQRDAKIEKAAVEELHSIMFPGTIPRPGHPLPPMRTTPLTPDELKRFTHSANSLISMGVPLPGYVASFASRFYVPLKRP